MVNKKVFAIRARIAKDIIVEILPPKKDSGNVVIICPGFPSPSPTKNHLLGYWSDKNYWAILPRYRGTWESDGRLMAKSPAKDLTDIIDALGQELIAVDNKRFRIKAKKIFIFGVSYGAVPSLLAANDPRISKIVLFAPLVDWTADSKDEPFDDILPFVKKAFGRVFQIHERNWHRLKTGRLFNPINAVENIDGRKILIVHAKDDQVVPAESVLRFAKESKAHLIMLPRGGHLSSMLITKPKLSRIVQKFIK